MRKKSLAISPRVLSLTPTFETAVYHPDEGQSAFTKVTPILLSMTEEELASPQMNIETGVYAALGASAFYKSPTVHARFSRLPKEDFNHAEADGLEQACFAALFAISEARAAGALESDALVDPEIAAEAAEVEERMQTTCEHLLSDDPEIKRQLDRLRPGLGYRDLANDLLGYARIYDQRLDVVKKDPKFYRPGDAARAKELAGKIIQALTEALTPQGRDAYSTCVRAWTLVVRRYEEIRQAGLWLFRKDAQKDQRFPSLYAVGRPGGGRPRKQLADITPPDAPAAPPVKLAAPSDK
ncbi:MAG: hypothetical protein U0441_12805 [Polyangiaceae bacterium]